MKQYIWHIPSIMCKEKAGIIHIQIVEEQIEKQRLFNNERSKIGKGMENIKNQGKNQ